MKTVKFSSPENKEEEKLIFHVLEDMGNRILVEYRNPQFKIYPTFVYRTAELTTINE